MLITNRKPTKIMSISSGAQQLRPWSQINPSGVPMPEGYQPTAAEILQSLTEQFNKLPVSYSTLPTGQVLATKSMPKMELPVELAKYPRYQQYFQLAGSEPENLTSSWVLPQGALTSPATTQYNPPSSDYSRQTGYNLGLTGYGQQNIARVNLSTFWPQAAFNLPMRETSLPNATSEPVFGATVDYTTGKYYTPSEPTTLGSLLFGKGTQQTYGTFNPAQKTSPGVRSSLIGGYQPSTYRPPSSAFKTKTKKRDLLSGVGGVYGPGTKFYIGDYRLKRKGT